MAGIELGYTGHLTRGASTSAAATAGLWVSMQTFKQFYLYQSHLLVPLQGMCLHAIN